jgi:hypothetical protein
MGYSGQVPLQDDFSDSMGIIYYFYVFYYWLGDALMRIATIGLPPFKLVGNLQ